MSLVLSAVLAASAATLPQCSWDRPGVNPFMGDVVAAVDHYQDIPVAVRERLKQRMRERQYDEVVSIQRDAVKGRSEYGSEITDMHFGAGSVCKTVSRKQWAPQAEERGLVYCEDKQCILVPTVCRNVSRIKRKLAAVAPARGAADAASSREQEFDPQAQLEMDPPGAGPAAGMELAEPYSFSQIAGLTPSNVGSLSSLESTPSAGNGGGYGGGSSTTPTVGGLAVTPYLPVGTTDSSTPVSPAPPIPEPGTWMMLALGLGVLGLAQRRRQR